MDPKEQPMSTNTSGNKRKTTGICLLLLGIVGYVLSLILLAVLWNNDNPWGPPALFCIALAVLAISPFVAMVGLARIITSATGISLVALVCGISGFLLPPLSLLAIILGAISLARSRRDPAIDGRKIAIASMVLGIISIVAWGIWFLGVLIVGHIL